ncbi:uncharacterized protein PITG_10285 [Phytophthora infestans T30-4]|uniref:RING-type domain-containing protein n=2 Tax=Phytophthora infestans TaxID=4787 RepID=D0NEZ0_PHYIT|nr:uncharacterized protein PITG_10285 [Phytophthora infestans T30-4]EEY56779.1 conserved hypothetical protein [Phytophthora infestans T30-4]KAF4030337.1 hypothetical protein GN244_ATG17829 [Phytophthora infestans]KAF4142690.1 hypothetical protein GN958_ATG08154 [Phytophthora infestans]|eukprot:XP_002902107.1 conserved hypothetical protein [Phytophthora infestans T30-4]
MASPHDVGVTMEGERSKEEEDKDVENNGERTEEGTEEQDVIELDSDEEHHEEEEHKQEESEDEVQFMGNTEAANEHQGTGSDGEQSHEDDVVFVDSEESSNGQSERSRANTDAVMAAQGYVTPATLEAELQCIICQYAMFKPVSAICGHSFCRVCLMDSFLTRPIEEAQCPICRLDILQPFSTLKTMVSLFSVNVTLWNLVQLLIPSVAERISTYQEEEEQEFKQKLIELDSKWTLFNLSEQAARYHGDQDEDDAEPAARWEEDHEGHDEYPVVKVEDTRDGNLSVLRNIVLDTNDENEDGYVNMRVGLAIVEFPSLFELYNEHQECSVNVIKMEEDEEAADGMPFFMNEDGDDDGFVCGSYYNEIRLRVCDEANNCVMERTRGARGGVVSFPGLRLDVPGGMYTFRFSDDLYGLKLSITTRLREPHEVSDTPVADYVGLINDEARDASRRNRRREHGSDNEDDYDEGNDSDDSFIVDDLNVRTEQPVGRFSDDEAEDQWQYHSDDEAADEEREQQRVGRQQAGRRTERDVQFVDEHDEEEVSEHEEHDGSEEAEEEVRPGRRNARVVEEAAFSSDGEADVDAADEEKDEEQHGTLEVARPRRRNANQIVDSEDEDEGDEEEPGNNDEDEHNERGNDNEDAIKEEEVDAFPRNSSRKVKREQWFESEESDEEDTRRHLDAAFSPCENVTQDRPRKRSRQVRVVDEGESEEEEEQMQRSIVAANSGHGHDEDEGDAHVRRVHLYDEETDERHDNEDDVQKDDAPDYPDEGEENEYQEEQDDYY